MQRRCIAPLAVGKRETPPRREWPESKHSITRRRCAQRALRTRSVPLPTKSSLVRTTCAEEGQQEGKGKGGQGRACLANGHRHRRRATGRDDPGATGACSSFTGSLCLALLLSRGSAEGQEKRRRRPRGRPRTVEHHLTSSRRLEASRDCTRAMPDASGPVSCAHAARVLYESSTCMHTAHTYTVLLSWLQAVVRAQGTAPCASYIHAQRIPRSWHVPRKTGSTANRRPTAMVAGGLSSRPRSGQRSAKLAAGTRTRVLSLGTTDWDGRGAGGQDRVRCPLAQPSRWCVPTAWGQEGSSPSHPISRPGRRVPGRHGLMH